MSDLENEIDAAFDNIQHHGPAKDTLQDADHAAKLLLKQGGSIESNVKHLVKVLSHGGLLSHGLQEQLEEAKHISTDIDELLAKFDQVSAGDVRKVLAERKMLASKLQGEYEKLNTIKLRIYDLTTIALHDAMQLNKSIEPYLTGLAQIDEIITRALQQEQNPDLRKVYETDRQFTRIMLDAANEKGNFQVLMRELLQAIEEVMRVRMERSFVVYMDSLKQLQLKKIADMNIKELDQRVSEYRDMRVLEHEAFGKLKNEFLEAERRLVDAAEQLEMESRIFDKEGKALRTFITYIESQLAHQRA